MRNLAAVTDTRQNILTKIISISIVAIIFAVVVVYISTVRITHTKVDDAKHLLFAISTALDRYNQDFGKYPTVERGLAALIQPRPKGRYFENDKFMLDPWHQKFIYTIDNGNKKYTLKSIGPNGVDDNGLVDDIVVEKTL